MATQGDNVEQRLGSRVFNSPRKRRSNTSFSDPIRLYGCNLQEGSLNLYCTTLNALREIRLAAYRIFRLPPWRKFRREKKSARFARTFSSRAAPFAPKNERA